MIDRVRTFIGYREYPTYRMVSRYVVDKQALLDEAEHLVRAHVLRAKEDVFYLTFSELGDVVRTNRVDEQLIGRRTEAFRSYQALTPPRALTSDGEVIAGAYRRDDVRAGALIGLPVSAGTVDGRARVILDMARADLKPGDILVTALAQPTTRRVPSARLRVPLWPALRRRRGGVGHPPIRHWPTIRSAGSRRQRSGRTRPVRCRSCRDCLIFGTSCGTSRRRTKRRC